MSTTAMTSTRLQPLGVAADGRDHGGGGDAALPAALHVGSVEPEVGCVSSRGFEQNEHLKLISLSIGGAHAF